MELPNKENIQSIENAMFIEHNVQRIITNQEVNGVRFNKVRARFYIHVLREYQLTLYKRIRPLLSLEVQQQYGVPVRKPYLQNGEYSSQVTKWYGEEIPDIGGQFSRVEFVEPNLGQRNKLIQQLIRVGWVPAAFTEKGNPKITVNGEPCPSLLKINNEVGLWIAQWYTYRHRESQINSWLEAIGTADRLSAQAITIGTPTFRFRHKLVVNVPKAAKQVIFGKQIRSLYTVEDIKRYRLVGHDASGLELRMLAHYINDDEFTKEVIGGDIHTKNQKDAGLPTRDDAKTFIYAFIYGAGDAKIGQIIKSNARAGKKVKQKFLQNNPNLEALITSTQRSAKKGYLVGLDGRKIHLRRDLFTHEVQTHKALNSLLQCAGATVMKWSMVILDEWVRQYNLDVRKVIDMHDEAQAEVAIKDIPMYMFLAEESIRQAGRTLQLNCPLDTEAKAGTNWAATH